MGVYLEAEQKHYKATTKGELKTLTKPRLGKAKLKNMRNTENINKAGN